MKKKITIRASIAFILWGILLSAGYVLTAKYPNAQFSVFAAWLTIGLTAYTGKRLFQRSPKFKDKE